MTNVENTEVKSGEAGANIGILVVILFVTTVGWFLLSELALHTRVQDATELAKGLKMEDYNQGKAWATDLLGLAGALAGFLGIVAAQRLTLNAADRAHKVEGGMIGILAGATLLGLGGWPVPIVLAALVTGSASVRLAERLKEP